MYLRSVILKRRMEENEDCSGFFSDIACGKYSCMYKRRSKKRETEYQRRSNGS